jgi:hypothetical protein
MSPRKSELAAIEAAICRDVGRKTAELMAVTKGELAAAAASLAQARSVGFITGFFVRRDDVAAPETDGPVGTALLASALAACGVAARIAVDEPCAAATVAAVSAAGGDVTVDVVVDIGKTAATWRDMHLDHVVAIERCGRSSDGKPRNMRGVDVSPWTLPLDDLFLGGRWKRLAIGDGGNEVGMGKLPAGMVARTVPNGEQIACVTSCDQLIVAGVSNWGAYGLMAALAVERPEWREKIAAFLTAERDRAVTLAVVAAGGVDGVTAQRRPTVDGLGAEVHGALIEELRRIAWGKAAA